MKMLRFSDFKEFNIQDLSIRCDFAPCCVFNPGWVQILGTNVLLVKGDWDTKVFEYEIEESYLTTLFEKILMVDFFKMKRLYDPISVSLTDGIATVDKCLILDGGSSTLTVQLGEKQKVVESYNQGCLALEPVFDYMNSIVLTYIPERKM